MEWGDHSQTLVAQFHDRGLKVPAHLLPPPIIFGAEAYVEAFWSCSSDRTTYPGIGMIPFSTIDRYAKRYGYDAIDEFSVLEYLIRKMDKTYLEKKRQQDG